MIKLVATTLVANSYLALSASESNYFIGQINLADAILQPNAFPMGTCSLTAAGTTSLSYGVYTCESDNQVLFEDYGSDSTCTGASVDTTTYSRDDSLSEGDLFSFYCDGENNFQVANTCSQTAVDDPPEDGGDVCCQDQGTSVIALLLGGCLPYTSATGVCMPTNITDTTTGAALYNRIECDGVDSVVDLFATSDCDPLSLVGSTSSASVEECAYFDTLALTTPLPVAADVYRALTSCVADSLELTNTSYCTMEPTMAPTDPSMMPTEMPSMEPTDMPTLEPTMDSEEGDGDSAYALCLMISAIVSTMAFLF